MGAGAGPSDGGEALPPESVEGLSAENRRLREENARMEAALFSAMDPLVARKVIEGGVPDEKRPATVLFADLADFSSVAEDSPPEAVVAVLNQVFRELDPVLARYRGHLDKYLGDGLLAEFGVPNAASHHCLLAVLAGLSMQRRMRELRSPCRMRVGIASGTLLVGMMGSERRRSYTAVGDAVNLASRLQVLCPLGSVCVDEAVYHAAGRWLKARHLQEGLGHADRAALEAQLELLSKAVERGPTARQCLDAVRLCAEIGDLERAMRFYRTALRVEPGRRAELEQALAAAVMACEARAFLTIKGRVERVAVYEVLGQRDIWADKARLPARAMHVFRWLEAELALPEEELLAAEAVEGRPGRAPAVGALSGALAEAMGLGDAAVRDAFLTGYLCDAGKRDVPERVLAAACRPGDLPEEDRRLLRGHVSLAEAALAGAGFQAPRAVLAAIFQHHERFDGRGYPRGLRGEAISPLARIARVAATFEALTSWRPYRNAMTPPEALEAVEREAAGGALDPGAARAFLDVMRLAK